MKMTDCDLTKLWMTWRRRRLNMTRLRLRKIRLTTSLWLYDTRNTLWLYLL